MKNQLNLLLTIVLSIFNLVCSNNGYCYNSSIGKFEIKKTEIVFEQTINKFDFAKHNDINIFIKDLAKAVSTNDIHNVVEMMNAPLTDEYGGNPGNNTTSLSCKDVSDIFEKFDRIFTKGIISAIKKLKYRGFDTKSMNGDVIKNGEFLIEGDGNIDGDSPRPHIMLGIKKVNGIYKIYAIKFYS